MDSSPSSSLSSFRDYYQHTESYDEFANNQQIYIQDGLRSFKIAKLFAKINQKMKQENYWQLFYGFKRLQNYHNQRQLRKQQLLQNILYRKQLRQSNINIKSQYLHIFRQTIELEKRRQIQFANKGLLTLANKYYSILSFSFNRLILFNQKLKLNKQSKPSTPIKLTKQQIKLYKIAKAVRVIIIRHVFHVRIFQAFSAIRYYPTGSSNNEKNSKANSITFLKHKKQKLVNIKNVNRYEKIQKIYIISDIINKKLCSLMINFMGKLKFTISQNDQIDNTKDSPEIQLNFTKHMVYLTRSLQQNQRQRLLQSHPNETARLKFSFLVRKYNKKLRTIKVDYLLQWRRIVNIQHLKLRKEITKLQQIKRHYMEEM